MIPRSAAWVRDPRRGALIASAVVAVALVSLGVPRTAAAQGEPSTVIQGQSVSRTITATGPAGRVFVFGTDSSGPTSVSGLPLGATASFSPSSCVTPQNQNPSLPSSCFVTLTITTAPATPAGNFQIIVTGSASGGFGNPPTNTATTTFTLTVNPTFNYSLANSGNVTLTAGFFGPTTTMTATLLAGTTQPVSFSLSPLPAGVTAAFSAPSCNPTCTTTLTMTAAAGASAGTSTITVTGSSPNTPNKTTSFTLTVNAGFNYSLTASPGKVTVTAGGTPGSATMTATLLAGTTQPVSFSLSPLPTGITATFSALSCTPTCTTTLTITAAAGASASTSTITVTGSSPKTPPKTTSFTLNVNNTPRTLIIVSGNNQIGVINAPLPKPLVVSVSPATPSVTVTCEASGGAIPSVASTPTIDGLAQFTLTLGPTPGPVTVKCFVSSDGIVASSSVTFVVNDATQAAVDGLKTFSVFGNLAVTTATVQSTNIGLRLAARRGGGGGGVSTSGLSLNVAGQSVPLAAAVTSLLSSGPGGGASADPSKIFAGLGIFLNGQGSFGDQEGTTREPGFKFHTEGLTLGTDYQLTENVVLGAAAGYLHTAADLDQAGGRAKMSGYSLSVFGTYYATDKFYVDAIATYGWNDYGMTRNITFGDVSATAKADPDGNQLAVSVSGGYNFNVGPLTIGPTARVNYINVRIDGFQERGADIFNLRANSQRIESLATDLGAQASYAISLPWGVLSPLVRAEWEHELKGGSRLITGSLVADPLRTPFSMPTNGSPDRNYVNLAAGLTATLPRGASAFVHYETVLGRAHVTNHSFTAGVRFQFE